MTALAIVIKMMNYLHRRQFSMPFSLVLFIGLLVPSHSFQTATPISRRALSLSGRRTATGSVLDPTRRQSCPVSLPAPYRLTTTTRLLQSSSSEDKVPSGTSSSPLNSQLASQNRSNNKNKNEGLLKKLDKYGQSLKPKAQQVEQKSMEATCMGINKVGLKLKACLFYSLYMGYRGYRGFFVILPAVFREVFRRLETSVDFRVLDDNEDYNGEVDINPETGKMRWRTRITVSILAGIVTFSYVIGGLARVLMKFFRTIVKTSSLSGSFLAAADEVEGNEGRIMRLTNNFKGNRGARDVNGQQQPKNKDDGSVGF